MCQCNPNVRTPYCGVGTCRWPGDSGPQTPLQPLGLTSGAFIPDPMLPLDTRAVLALESIADSLAKIARVALVKL